MGLSHQILKLNGTAQSYAWLDKHPDVRAVVMVVTLASHQHQLHLYCRDYILHAQRFIDILGVDSSTNRTIISLHDMTYH